MRKYAKDEDKNQIIKRYNSGETINSIARSIEMSPPAISRLLKNNGIHVVSNINKYESIRKMHLNKHQKSIIVGTLLGDGCLYSDNKKPPYKLSFGHTIKQEEYFMMKYNALKPFTTTITKSLDKRGNSTLLQTRTMCHPDLNRYYDLFYSNKKKINGSIGNHMTPLSLAIWIMDDGSLNAGVNLRIATMSFDYDDHIILQGMLKGVFGIRSKIMPFRYRGKTYNQLTLNKRNTVILSDTIRDHVVPSMRYKIINS